MFLAQDNPAIEQLREQVGATLAGPEFEIRLIAIRRDLDDQPARRVTDLETAHDAEMAAVKGIGDAQNRGEPAHDAALSGTEAMEFH
jgi:hypothetical protein